MAQVARTLQYRSGSRRRRDPRVGGLRHAVRLCGHETAVRAAQRLTGFFTAMAEAMIVVVHWILLAAPVGVFALALGVGLHAGFGAGSLLLQYVATVSLVIIAGTLVLYPIVGLWGSCRCGASPWGSHPCRSWPRARRARSPRCRRWSSAPVTRGRAATRRRPRPAARGRGVRYTSPMGNLAVCFFIAALYGFEPSLLQCHGRPRGVRGQRAAVGLPGQVSFITSVAPICLALGLPSSCSGS